MGWVGVLRRRERGVRRVRSWVSLWVSWFFGMRIRKVKEGKRSLNWFQTCLGFHPPFKVVCDPEFLQAALAKKIDVRRDVEKFVGQRCKVMTSRCVARELKRRGEEYAGALLNCRRLDHARCSHNGNAEFDRCLKALTGGRNKQEFFVATMDAGLRRELRQLGRVPVVYIKQNGLAVERPSVEAKRMHEEWIQQQTGVGDAERAMLRRMAGEGKGDEDAAAGEGSGSAGWKRRARGGVNPLAMKRKRAPEVNGDAPAERDADGGGAGGKKKVRRPARKRGTAGAVDRVLQQIDKTHPEYRGTSD